MRMLLALTMAVGTAMAAGCAEPAAERGVPLGELRGRDHVVAIRSTPEGVRYTVRTTDGRVLARNLDAQSLRAQWPASGKMVDEGLANDASIADERR